MSSFTSNTTRNFVSVRVVGITGMIGSGKSVVSRILRLRGYTVYDCDAEAKLLMDSSDAIKATIAAEIHPEAIDERGRIDRRRLAEIIFGNEEHRQRLNRLVHSAVREDIISRIKANVSRPFFIESAILAESGLAQLCDEIWLVDAGHDDVRIERVMKRNNCDAESVIQRIRAQEKELERLEKYSDCIRTLVNDGRDAVLPQIDNLTQITQVM